MYNMSFLTNLGPVSILCSARGICHLTLPGFDGHKQTPIPDNELTGQRPAYLPDLEEELKAYFRGTRVAFDFPLDLAGAPEFCLKVWNTVKNIPYGEVRSYGWVARELGRPAAARAVGQALARNPVPVIIPCHRVIHSNGTPGGFAGRMSFVETKLILLSLEGYRFKDRDVHGPG
ncbi:MAG: methylated-DNA--[protein]-cysteine S-methyltransferase [Chloroflexi bacterium]|nr:methylated-DNA--[protein]-cysteine S-methyltransferase [Chloroflexota bacterium]